MGNKYILDYKILGLRIKEMRKLKGLTQEQLAEMTDLSANFIAKIESNNSTVSLISLVKIANILDSSIDYLLCNTGSSGAGETDILINNMLKTFDEQDKSLLINIIREIKVYKNEKSKHSGNTN
ncbi:MAG: helix-turn-helix domain-containing protein [Oscillospiraceae bacterium]|nr:helix-turn-helix domain-containing protein [Oscillospiraceae bacterium]